MQTVTFVVDSLPPHKQTPADRTEKTQQEERTTALQATARESFQTEPLLSTPCSVSIRYVRNRGRADSANIIGGILDGLQGVVFKNDKQVVEISYMERSGEVDWYQVTVTELARSP